MLGSKQNLEKRIPLGFGFCCWDFEILEKFGRSIMDGASVPSNDDLWRENRPSLLG